MVYSPHLGTVCSLVLQLNWPEFQIITIESNSGWTFSVQLHTLMESISFEPSYSGCFILVHGWRCFTELQIKRFSLHCMKLGAVNANFYSRLVKERETKQDRCDFFTLPGNVRWVRKLQGISASHACAGIYLKEDFLEIRHFQKRNEDKTDASLDSKLAVRA